MTVTTTITWIPASGSQVILNNEVNYYVLVGLLGGESPSFTFVEEKFPELYGSFIKSVNVEPRTLSIPVKIVGTSLSELKTKLQALVSSFNPLLGEGVLKFDYGSSTRYLGCYYSSGLEGNDGLDAWGNHWWKGTVNFYAQAPYFYGAEIPTTYTLDEDAGDAFLSDPFFPMSIGESTVLGESVVNNVGDIESYPVFTLTGPGDTIILTNSTTGEAITLSGSGGLTLASGEELEIDCRPGFKTVTKVSSGANYFEYLSAGSILWSLVAGNNSINIQVNNATGVTEVILAYEPNYIGRP